MTERSSGLRLKENDALSIATNRSLDQNSLCQHEFANFCQRHDVSTKIQQNAYYHLQSLISQNILENEPKLEHPELFASVIYMSAVDARLPYGPSDPHLVNNSLESPSITVTDILKMANINIKRLFHTMNVIKIHYQLTDSVHSHLTRLERNYCIVSALFHTFQNRLCTAVFRSQSGCGDSEDSILPPMPESEGVPFRMKQCWVLFLLSKYNLLPPDQPELYQHFELLLCCLEFILRQTPSFLLNSPYDTIRFSYMADQKVPMLGKLAQEFGLEIEETIRLQITSSEPYFQSLLTKDEELDIDSLCEEYQKIYKEEGDLDELLFLNKDSHLLPPLLNNVTTKCVMSLQPSLSPGQITPVRAVIGTVQLLQENCSKLPDRPSDKLKLFFQKCIVDPSETIQQLSLRLKEAFVRQYVEQSRSVSQTAVAEQRFTLGRKLYFKVLETMMEREGSKLSQQVLNTLLNKESFHKSLLACALEVVLATYGQTWNQTSGELSSEGNSFSFPWILRVFNLQSYEFYKVVESFIQSEPKLPADIVKHLQNIEVQVLDSLAWVESSSLYEALGDWDQGQLTPPIPASPVKAADDINALSHSFTVTSKCAMELFLSPVRTSNAIYTSLLQSPSSTLSSPSAKQLFPSTEPPLAELSVCKLPAPCRSQSLTHFLKRVCALGFSRLSKLCNYLGVSKDLQQKIWTCFEYCVTKMPTLLRNRHVDQIIMCCIYGICKVVDQEIRFKSIVSEYKNLPHARQEIFRDVYMGKDKQDSIISFYNNIFMRDVKSFLLQFSPNRPMKPQLSPMPNQTLASPSYFSMPGRKNFTVSPLRESPFKTPLSPGRMTPRTQLLYNFGESSSEKLKEFNETIHARTNPVSARKRLNLDVMLPSSALKVRKSQ